MMEKKIGIVVCNYNKRDYVISCIESILNSSVDFFDLFVVDNASTDDSAASIEKLYSDKLCLIKNAENLGGSGGFNTGLRAALAAPEKYQYLMCVDNDIVMDKENIQQLYLFLESHKEVGMAGSKICRMKNPERLQELGADIDFESCFVKPYYKDYLDNDEIPEVQYCDYVPACSLMIRRDVVEQIGIMPQENFIYWDDMEWGYRVNQAGYKVAAYSKAKVLHAMGTTTGTNYFSTYYFWRNRIRFFIKYTPLEKREKMMTTLLTDLFQTLYGCYYKGKDNQIRIMMYAWDDAIHEVTGKASEGKILPKDQIEDRLGNLLGKKEQVVIIFNEDYKQLQKIILKAKEVNPQMAIVIVCEDKNQMKSQHSECNVIARSEFDENNVEASTSLILEMCEHVSKITDKRLAKVYIDSYSNLLENHRDIEHFECNEYFRQIFIKSQKCLIEQAINNRR